MERSSSIPRCIRGVARSVAGLDTGTSSRYVPVSVDSLVFRDMITHSKLRASAVCEEYSTSMCKKRSVHLVHDVQSVPLCLTQEEKRAPLMRVETLRMLQSKVRSVACGVGTSHFTPRCIERCCLFWPRFQPPKAPGFLTECNSMKTRRSVDMRSVPAMHRYNGISRFSIPPALVSLGDCLAFMCTTACTTWVELR